MFHPARPSEDPAAPPRFGDTIAALATPSGRGAVAIVRTSGSLSAAIAERVFTARALRDRLATSGRVVDSGGRVIDRGLALFFRGPHSYTGEDVLELHVHGSPVVARETLAAVLAAGARLATPGEFTRRAFLAGKMDLGAAEAVAALIAAEHRSAARAAAARLGGGLVAAVEKERSMLARALEELSAAVDFPDEVPEPDRGELGARVHAIRERLGMLTRTWERGRLVREGALVALAGAPNAGKSSLLNALLGTDRAIVSDVPGTTRDVVEETLALGDVAVRIADAAGIRNTVGAGTHGPLEAAGVERARATLAVARLAVVVVDASVPLSADAEHVLVQTRDRPRVIFFNKSDLGRSAYDARAGAERGALLGSVFCHEDVDALRDRVRSALAADAEPDLERPALASAREADAVLEACRALDQALAILGSGDPVDLTCGPLLDAAGALGKVAGREASEAVLEAVFARFCIGK